MAIAVIGFAVAGLLALWSMLMFWTDPSKCKGYDSLVSPCYFGPVAAVTVGSGLAGAAIATSVVSSLRRRRHREGPR
jgi:hypothetical protein